ncbi:MAG: D-alanyl-D-alanine carboxypeptidase family protein [Firmicutes bacterium]|nr:D-alanyl-D-alanine carboxypeptidase family protein [Bacillota bacterium]
MKKRLIPLLLLAAVIVMFAAPAASAATMDASNHYMLVNKDHKVSSGYVPDTLVQLNNYIPAISSVYMTQEAAQNMKIMIDAMKAAGITDINGQSGYRSYDTQTYLYVNKTNYYLSLGYSTENAKKIAGTIVAVPGSSEHQTGMALDFTTSQEGLEESFAYTPAGKWLAANSWKYGFILRYPKGKEDITGYIYEPWHFRYVGKVLAEYTYRNQLTLDEFYEKLETETILTLKSVTGAGYAIYLKPTASSSGISGQILGSSRAFADDNYSHIYITSLPNAELFDIIGHWSEGNIRTLAGIQVVAGYPNNTFRPNKNITRAELITLVGRVYTLLYPNGLDESSRAYVESVLARSASPYGDVPGSAYYLRPLLELEQANILPEELIALDAAGQEIFMPSLAAKRGEAALTIAPLFKGEEAPAAADGDTQQDEPAAAAETVSDTAADNAAAENGSTESAAPRYSDMADQSTALQEAVELLSEAGIIMGNPSGTFAPDNAITRAEICAMLCRVLTYFHVI